MRNKIFTILCLFGICTVMVACAQSKKTTRHKKSSKNTAHVTYIESLTQRTLPGRQETEPVTNTYHILVWNSTDMPKAFYWKDGSVWAPFNVSKAHATKKKMSGTTVYTTEEIRMENIRKGDTLQLEAGSAQGKYIVPAEVPDTATNTIFYKTDNTKWLPVPARKYRKLPDVIMP